MVASLALGVTATLYLAASVVVAGGRKPGYTHRRHTISELAEYGSECTRPVSFGVFLPIALCFALIASFLRLSDPPIAALALSIAAGYGLGAVFPCDPGSPAMGSVRQWIHNLGGAIQYLGGAFSLMWLGESGRPGFQTAGILVGLAAILLSFESPVRGVIQRIAESCLFFGCITALWISESHVPW